MAVKRIPRKNSQRSAQTRSATSLKTTLRGIESTLAQVTDDLGRVKRLAHDADLRSRIALGEHVGIHAGGRLVQEPLAADYTAQAQGTDTQPERAVARTTLLQRLNEIGAQAAGEERALLYLFEKVRALYERLGVEWGEELTPPAPYELLSL